MGRQRGAANRTGAATAKVKKVTASKPKKVKIARTKSQKPKIFGRFEKQVILTEKVAMGDTLVMYVEKEFSGDGGYMAPLVKKSLSGQFPPFDENQWDVFNGTYLFMRQSHEENKKFPTGSAAANGVVYNRCAIFAWPSKAVAGTNGKLDMPLEKKFWDVGFEVLAQASTKFLPEESYAEWDESHIRTPKKGPLRSLDELFTDESVANILYSYFIPSYVKEQDVYNYMVENEIENIYKRKQSDGKFSDFVIARFGFPDDSVQKEDGVSAEGTPTALKELKDFNNAAI